MVTSTNCTVGILCLLLCLWGPQQSVCCHERCSGLPSPPSSSNQSAKSFGSLLVVTLRDEGTLMKTDARNSGQGEAGGTGKGERGEKGKVDSRACQVSSHQQPEPPAPKAARFTCPQLASCTLLPTSVPGQKFIYLWYCRYFLQLMFAKRCRNRPGT